MTMNKALVVTCTVTQRRSSTRRRSRFVGCVHTKPHSMHTNEADRVLAASARKTWPTKSHQSALTSHQGHTGTGHLS